jgi:glycosyltransferase involved in cell wall biosynthesis
MKARILVAHASYRQRGGEDIVVDDEIALLEKHDHAVCRYLRDNRDIDERRPLKTAVDTIWSTETTQSMRQLIADFKPDVIHVHNTFPALSPSLYWEAGRNCVPVVQTLHNFRLLCPQAMLLRNGNVCEDCLGRAPWRAIAHGCYRGSSAKSAVLSSMLMTHRALGTYRHKIARYIALNEFCRDKFIAGGFPADKIAIKPNFADLPQPNPLAIRRGALFVGRLSREKGVDTVLNALSLLPKQHIEAVGEGPERDRVVRHPQIIMHGWIDQERLFRVMRRHAYLILPSIWYENSPRTLIEAFGCGLAVIASRLGALAELIDDGRTGMLVEPNSPADLARAMRWAEEHPNEMRAMGERARTEFETHYTPERNYDRLVAIYDAAIESQYSYGHYEGAL